MSKLRPHHSLDARRLKSLADELSTIHDEMRELEHETLSDNQDIREIYRQSARNLVHYLALRRHDIRELQEKLASLALSSLGRAESNVKLTIEMLLEVLHGLLGESRADHCDAKEGMSPTDWKALLEEHTVRLLGPKPKDRNVRIMVTAPSEAATRYDLVRDLLLAGMDCLRINCAHDGVEAWAEMVSNLRRARGETGRNCRILMDLPGPKLRTGPVQQGPRVIKWRPHRDAFGTISAPARILLTPIGGDQPTPSDADACIPVNGEWLSRLNPGDTVRFFDARDASRLLSVVGIEGESRWAESRQTSYVTPGTILQVSPRDDKAACRLIRETSVGGFAAREKGILLKTGDTLILTRDSEPGSAAVHDSTGRLIQPARIGMTLPVFSDVQRGDAVWLDDGIIGGRVRRVGSDELEIEITHARPQGERVKADKGINLPDTKLSLPALTDSDLQYLEFISANADLVGYSFVRRASDVFELQERLSGLGGEGLGIVLKIETRTAFEELPALLLAAMRSPAAGVMIARGDLAIECGFERMAEVQEELLWFCEAAHMPVIWATQVLESLAREGLPSRAEITDAAMGERAECVMLNKGPYVVEAVRALDDILRRMQFHQTKKRSLLRSLKVANRFGAGPNSGRNRG